MRVNPVISCIVLVSLTLLSGSFFITDNEANATEFQIKKVYPLIPTQSGTFDTWVTGPTAMDKATAVKSNDGDTSYLLRQSDSKWQTFIFENALVGTDPIPSGAGIQNVTLYAFVKNTGNISGSVSLGCETGNNKPSIYEGTSTTINPGTAYEKIKFTFDKNPATKPLRNWDSTDLDDWVIDGKQMSCGILNQDRQNAAPIWVTEFWAEIAYDASPPVISPIISGTLGDNGWYTSDVTLSWSIVDNESPIISQSPGCSSQQITAETTGTDYSCTATSGGGTSTATTTIKLDKTGPVLILPSPIVQASTPDGENVDYIGDVSANDSISDPSTVTSCTPSSGTQFVIGFTDVTCSAKNNAGLTSSGTFVVQVNPYILISFANAQDGVVPMEKNSTILVVDPWINLQQHQDSILVNVSSTAKTLVDPATIILELNSITPTSNQYEGEVLLTAGVTNGTSHSVHVDNQATVFAQYPNPPDPRTSITSALVGDSPQGGSLGAGTLSQSPLQWVNDVYTIETSGIITSYISANPCSSLPPSRTVHVWSVPDPAGFDIVLQKDGTDKCSYTSPKAIKLSASASDPTIPRLKVNPWTYVNVNDTPAGGSNFANAFVIPNPTALPTGGVAFDSVALECGVGNDVDNDGLCDSWEKPTGLSITYGSGTFNYGCKPLIFDTSGAITSGSNVCGSPNHKDIYLEIDFMFNHKPNLNTLQQVRDVFLNAPVLNPDGTTGINLHILVDENTFDHQELLSLTDFYATKAAKFGTVAERTGLNPSDVITAKRQAFHWMYNIHSQLANPTSSGYGEVGGQDFLVSMGAFPAHTGTNKQQASTIIHELGHNLHLNHGGAATNTQNCKPHYISLMNYAYQFDIWTNNPLNLSRVQNVNINENDPDEVVGMNANNGLTAVYGPSNHPTNPGPKTVVLNANTSIDWDRSGSINNANNVAANINYLPIKGCQNDDGYPVHDILTGYNDWTGMSLHFRQTSAFADGVSSLDPIGGVADMGINEPKSTIIPVIGARPVAIAGDENGAADSINRNEGDVILLTSYSTDSDGIINGSKFAEPTGVMWDVDNTGVFDDPGDAKGSPSPLYADDDESLGQNSGSKTFTVGLRVLDNAGNESDPDDTLDIVVHNVAPQVIAGSNIGPINEGSSITLAPSTFNDPGINDTHQSLINWGDNSPVESGVLSSTPGTAPVFNSDGSITPLVPISGSVSGTHTYLDDDADDQYTVSVSVWDEDGGNGTGTFIVQVVNVNPVVTGGANQSIVVMGTPNLSASFTDPGKDTWTAVIDYGDGSTTTLNNISLGQITIPPHQYTNIGNYTAKVTVSDDDGGSGFATIQVNVGLGFSGTSPIQDPLDQTKISKNRNLPVKAEFIDALGNPIQNLNIKLWLDNLNDNAPEFKATSTIKKVKDNTMTWNPSLGGYDYSLDVSKLQSSVDGVPHKLTVKVLDSSGNVFASYSLTILVEG